MSMTKIDSNRKTNEEDVTGKINSLKTKHGRIKKVQIKNTY